MILGAVPAHVLVAALDLDLFSYFTEPLSVGALVGRTGWHPGNTGVFLNALCACGLLCKDADGTYALSDLAARHLGPHARLNMGDLFRLSQAFWIGGLDHISDLVKKGSGAVPTAAIMDERAWSEMTRCLAVSQQAGLASFAVRQAARLPGHGSWRKMLDLGGGAGFVALEMTKAIPGLQAVLFDHPAVCLAAEELLGEADSSGAVRILAGDYNTDDIGSGYDLVWASNSLHFASQGTDSVLVMIRDSLVPGGACMLFHEGLEKGRTGPGEHVFSGLMTALRGQDLFFDAGELKRRMEHVGFCSVTTTSHETDWGVFELTVGYRPS